MKCPKCPADLAENATYCGCGWKKLQPRFEHSRDPDVSCAHEDCGIAAMCKVQTKTGWANLCWQHYDSHFARQAVENLASYGMERSNGETQAEHTKRMRYFVKNSFKGFSSKSLGYAAGTQAPKKEV